jgi:hypothetical protein
MKKIGNTLAGSVIVEMTSDEYQALEKLQGKSENHPSTPDVKDKASDSMTREERVAYVAERLKKLQPKKRDSVVRSIESMFQFTGGIVPTEVDSVLKSLIEQRFFTIDENGRVSYE